MSNVLTKHSTVKLHTQPIKYGGETSIILYFKPKDDWLLIVLN